MAKQSSTPASLADELVRARSLSAEMSTATDELNTALQSAEKAIATLKLGVTASVVMNPEEEGPWTEALVFGKDKQVWRLLYETGLDGDNDVNSTPLVNASRAIRLKAVDHLPALLEALIARAAQEVEDVRAKTEAVNDLTSTIAASSDEIPF